MDDRNPDAFRALYQAHYRTVCRYLAARADRDMVEDVAADTFLVAWRRQAELPDHVVPWLLNTASKCLANQRRMRERRSALVERLSGAIPADPGGVDEDLARQRQRRALMTALTACGERDRELLLLRHWDGLAPREMATVLDLNPVVLRARLHRASKRLARSLATALESDEPPARARALSQKLRPERDLKGH